MGAEPSHVQLVEYKKEVIPYIDWMMEDIFCRYGASIPYYLLEFDFPEYPFTPQHISSGYGFGVDWGDWGSFLPWFNELIGLAFDLADLPRWQFTPWEIPDWKMPEWGIPDWELPQWQLRDWPEWSMKDGELRKRWGRRLGPELDVLDYMYIPPGRGFGAGVSGALGAGWRIGADWTVGGTLSARLGIEIPVSIELSAPDWTVKMELEGQLREDPMRLTEGQYPLGIEGFFPERTIKGKISAALGIEAPMFGEPTISPQFGDMLNERMSALYDSVAVEYTFESQTKDGYLQKVEAEDRIDMTSWAALWSTMRSKTPSVITATNGISITFEWAFQRSPSLEYDYDRFRAVTQRGYLSFDTSSLSGKTVTSVTLRIYVTSVRPPPIDPNDSWQSETTNMLHVYDQDWGTLGTDDWDGGSSVGSVDVDDVTKDEYNEITLTTSVINVSGETQLKLAWLGDIDDYTPTDSPEIYNGDLGAGDYAWVGGGFVGIYSGDYTENKPQLVVEATG